MKFIVRTGCFLGLSLCIALPPALASNGMLLIGYGAKARGMGGVGLALTEDALVAAINPAGIADVEDRADGGLLIFNPKRRAVCCLAPGGEVSDKGWFFIPNLAATYKLNDEYSLGFGFVGYGGGRTEYSQNIFDAADTGPAGANLEIALMSPSISYRLNPQQSLGVSLLIGISRFSADGLDPFKNFSLHPTDVTDKGHDYAYGAGLRLGWLGHYVDDTWSFAAVYQTEVNMSEFDSYRGLFPEGGKLNLPAILSLGTSFKPLPELTIAFDWSRVFYSDVPALGNRSLPITTAANDPRLMGQPGGPGFGWQDVNVFKLGAQYELNASWTARAGINYGKQPINNEAGGGEFEFNVLAPAVTELHVTGGGTYKMDERQEISFAIMHAFNNKESQDIPGGTGLPFESQTIELEMEQWSWDIGYGYKF